MRAIECHPVPNFLIARREIALSLLLIGTAILSGCGKGPSSQAESKTIHQAADVQEGVQYFAPGPGGTLPENIQKASAQQSVRDDDWEKELDEDRDDKLKDQLFAPAREQLVVKEPDKGTPEWMIREITKLRAQPVNIIRQPVAGKAGEFENAKLPDEQVPQERRRRSEQVIELASQAIAQTYQDQERQQVFNNAVHYLADARLELALEGDTEQASTLNDDAEVLYKRDPKSFAAVETAHRVLQLTLTQAQKYGEREPRWTQALARQARQFAQRFPQEQSRAAMFLITAGRHCDQQGLLEEAHTCLALVRSEFAKTPFAAQVEAPLRRLELPGKALAEFAGSTHDGGFVDIQKSRGKFTFIAFWSSDSEKFKADAPRLQQTLAAAGNRVVAVGVNLDRDEVALDRFLESTPLPWQQIFYSDAAKRGYDNMVARYYGVAHVPQYWLVGPDGVVRSINVQVDQLPQLLTTR